MFMLYVLVDVVVAVVVYLFGTMFLFLRDSFIYYFCFDAALVFSTQRFAKQKLEPK